MVADGVLAQVVEKHRVDVDAVGPLVVRRAALGIGHVQEARIALLRHAETARAVRFVVAVGVYDISVSTLQVELLHVALVEGIPAPAQPWSKNTPVS